MQTAEDVYDQFDPMARQMALSWVGGYITHANGVFDIEQFMNAALALMPAQIVDEAIEKWRLRIEWPEVGPPFFRVASPHEE